MEIPFQKQASYVSDGQIPGGKAVRIEGLRRAMLGLLPYNQGWTNVSKVTFEQGPKGRRD